MSKIDLDPITSGYNLSKINANFQKVEDELNNKVLYRNPPAGEPNSMSSNLDMNSRSILNASKISSNVLELGGVQVVPTNLAVDPYNGTREALRRSYAAAGYHLVGGSFEAGGTLVNANDVLLQERTGKAFSGPAGAVAGGTDPTSGGFVDRSGYPSVVDYGATGTVDDTVAFTLAQNAHKFIEIPEGMTFNVSPGLNYWQFFGKGSVSEQGRQWSIPPYPQTGALGKHYVERTFGIYEQAVGQSITINSGQGQTKENTQVLGTDTKGLAQDYTDRDHVAQYISSYSYTPDVLDATTTYTATTLTNAEVGALHSAGKIKLGMVIDTLHATICTGRVQSVSGNTITVDVWWPRVGAAPVTPSNGTGAIINPNNKIFGQNIVVRSSGNGTTTGSIKFSGVELDLFTPPSSSPVSGTWGYDMAVLGGYLDVGYQIRGKRNISFFSNNAGGGGLFGLRSIGDSKAVSIEDVTIKAIEVVTGGSQRFSVDPDGTTHIVGGALHFIGELQTTDTFASIGLPWAVGHGALFYITGFNTSNGNEGKFLIAANNTGAGSVYSSDGSGATVSFQVSGNTLQIRSTTGVYQFTAFQLLI